MKCNEVHTLFEAYQDGVLKEEKMTAIRTHLQNCPDCRRALLPDNEEEKSSIHIKGNVTNSQIFSNIQNSNIKYTGGDYIQGKPKSKSQKSLLDVMITFAEKILKISS